MANIKLTQRVMVQQLVLIADAGGGQARNWSDFREVWAQVQWASVSQSVENGEIGRRRRANIILRWAPDLPDPIRLIVEQKTLTVLANTRAKVGGGEFLEIECEDTF